jgi:DNA-binding MarR family transcriptional regulator
MTREQDLLTVLEAVADACAAGHEDGASTGSIARRLRANGSLPARRLLRALRRRGYVRTIERSVDGAPLRWALTAAGRALMATHCRTTGQASPVRTKARADRSPAPETRRSATSFSSVSARTGR